jgi:N-carbamoyl-L-amino-acid hydrolase
MTSATTLLGEIADVGTDRFRGGYARHGFDRAELELRAWFTEQAQRRGLDVQLDRNGNLWAWWGTPGPGTVATGSHLDSVPGGGAFDGPLGVVSALAAVDALRAKGFAPTRPIAVVVFAEEEGGRFGMPCLGSRLATGAIDPDTARCLRDPDGISLAEAVRAAGLDPAHLGRDDAALTRLSCFVELHVEQGRQLDLRPERTPVAVASSILAHGRWRLTFRGEGNHAGTTAAADRRDPMIPAASTVLAARRLLAGDDARATVGRLVPTPGGTNVIPSSVDIWLDARTASTPDTRGLVEEIIAAAQGASAAEGCALDVREESFGDTVVFDAVLRDQLAGLLGGVPALPTGAGHDSGILANQVPTAMLFVRNPTGVSHAPDEHAEPDDCAAGVTALARVLEHLAG